MPPRFFAPGVGAAPIVMLPDEEALHLTRVLRLKAGAMVTVFDGEGREFLARVEQIDRSRVSLRVLEPTQPAGEPAVRIRLAQAVLKGDSMDAAIRDATMLGVSEIQPVVTARVIGGSKARWARRARGTGDASGGPVDRWGRIAVASVKQCGRAVVPRIYAPSDLNTFLAAETAPLKLCLIEPSAGPVPGTITASMLRDADPPASCTILTGPEGGWAPDEIARIVAAGFIPVSLGARTLRAEAVAVVALALVQFVWGDL